MTYFFSRRHQTRHETDVMDEVLNDEELAVDAAIGDTFQKMMLKSSPELFTLVFNKLKTFVETRVFEAAVSGNILAGMCKSAVSIQPERALDFFIPHLCGRIESALRDRVGHQKADIELQFSTLLLSEVIVCKFNFLHEFDFEYLLF